MKYILQAKKSGHPEWMDLKHSEDAEVIEKEFKEKAKIIPLNSLRIVKEMAIQTNFDIKMID